MNKTVVQRLIIKFKFKFIKTTKGSKGLLQVAKTYNRHKTNKRYMYTLYPHVYF